MQAGLEYEKNKVSVVVPVWEEGEGLRSFCNKLVAVLKTLGKKFEIILVDDGSDDGTFHVMEEIRAAHKNITVIKLRHNFGQHFAIFSGIRYADGEVVITSPADAEYELEYIPQFIKKIEEGYDIVFGWRRGYTRGFFNCMFIAMLRPFFRTRVHDFTSTFRAFTFSVAGTMRRQGSINKAPAGVTADKCAEVDIGFIENTKRKSGYSCFRKIKLAVLIVSQVAFDSSYPATGVFWDNAIEKILD